MWYQWVWWLYLVYNFYFVSVDPTMQSTRVSFSPRKTRVMLSSRMSTARRNAGLKHEVISPKSRNKICSTKDSLPSCWGLFLLQLCWQVQTVLPQVWDRQGGCFHHGELIYQKDDSHIWYLIRFRTGKIDIMLDYIKLFIRKRLRRREKLNDSQDLRQTLKHILAQNFVQVNFHHLTKQTQTITINIT